MAARPPIILRGDAPPAAVALALALQGSGLRVVKTQDEAPFDLKIPKAAPAQATLTLAVFTPADFESTSASGVALARALRMRAHSELAFALVVTSDADGGSGAGLDFGRFVEWQTALHEHAAAAPDPHPLASPAPGGGAPLAAPRLTVLLTSDAEQTAAGIVTKLINGFSAERRGMIADRFAENASRAEGDKAVAAAFLGAAAVAGAPAEQAMLGLSWRGNGGSGGNGEQGFNWELALEQFDSVAALAATPAQALLGSLPIDRADAGALAAALGP